MIRLIDIGGFVNEVLAAVKQITISSSADHDLPV